MPHKPRPRARGPGVGLNDAFLAESIEGLIPPAPRSPDPPAKASPKPPAQASTTSTSVLKIIRSRGFNEGVGDVRLGRAPRYDDPIARDWSYERGRQWATIAPEQMPTKIGGKVNPEAVALLLHAAWDGAIL
jgi:hypothetical protein